MDRNRARDLTDGVAGVVIEAVLWGALVLGALMIVIALRGWFN